MTILFYSLVIIFLIIFPADTADTALRAIRIWGTSIVPVLFPYMIFSRLLCRSLYAHKLPAEPVTSVLGMLGGSPSGATVIAAHSSRLSHRSAYMLCTLTGTISPMFILGTIQSWTNDPLYCRLLLLCHWLGAILGGWIVWILCRKDGAKPCPHAEGISDPFPNPINQSVDAILQVGGCVICYSVLSGMLGKILYPFPFLHPLFHAVLEVSGGVHALCQSNLPSAAKSVLLSAALGFSGLSILSQNHAMLRPLGIRMRQLILFAALRAASSAAVMALMLCLQPFS